MSSRLATLAQAMSSTSTTPVCSTSSGARTSPTSWSRIDTDVPVKPLRSTKARRCGRRSRLRSTIAFICASSCSRVAPGARRAIMLLNSLPRAWSVVSSGAKANGTSRAMSRAGSSKSAGSTPTTRWGSPSMRTSRPTMFWSAANLAFHRPKVRMANRSAPVVASPSANARPIMGARPSVEKNDGVTRSARTCSGDPPSARLRLRCVKSAASSMAGAWVRRSR